MANNEPGQSDAFLSALEELRKEYLSRWPEKRERFEELLRDFGKSGPDILKELRTEFHRLAGSGGSYGLPAVSKVGSEAETFLDSLPGPEGGVPEEAGARIRDYVQALEKIFSDAAKNTGA